MDKDQALRFLEANQPMPPDGEISQELINAYDAAREYFLENPDAQAIPLLLNSFGDGDGLGVYQLVEDAIGKYSHTDVIPHLKSALLSKHPSVRYWCAQIAANFPSSNLLDFLEPLLDDNEVGIREAVVMALEQIDDSRVAASLKRRLSKETDEGVRNLIMEVLAG